ncbi:hypothetical protein [Aeromicrobium sp. IC_218]|uniref:hypothetical protein n=1 Tax=Aeromicrobium sp. IC_218 TaxID=2545468 RepID=UPI001038F5A1|nr:hypothetical protein [Aeromicrobium sp. IC_218]TCI98834.1 hypothetical protein E0W78_08760 [Aeromicrobium sp. IC_218]
MTEAPVPHSSALPDLVLRDIVAAVDAVNSFDIGITLWVHGQVVSGDLIASHAYGQGVSGALRQRAAVIDNGAILESFTVLFDQRFPEPVPAQERTERPPEPEFLHLRQVSFLDADSKGTTLAFWRGALSSVDGWTLGRRAITADN